MSISMDYLQLLLELNSFRVFVIVFEMFQFRPISIVQIEITNILICFFSFCYEMFCNVSIK